MDWRKKKLKIGEAEYEYCGDCIGCEIRLFKCVSDPIREDEKLGNRLPTFYADSTKMCGECASGRL